METYFAKGVVSLQKFHESSPPRHQGRTEGGGGEAHLKTNTSIVVTTIMIVITMMITIIFAYCFLLVLIVSYQHDEAMFNKLIETYMSSYSNLDVGLQIWEM